MTILDVAGHPTGGAARFRREAERWIGTQLDPVVRLVGIGERVEPRWLLRRELIARRDRRIAANNMSFLAGRGRRIVLLRNALHFLRPGEMERLPAMPIGLRRQTPIVRAAAPRADVIVVPSTDMADRVIRILPTIEDRVVVRHHPLRVAVPRHVLSRNEACPAPYILYPSMPALHKDVVGSLRQLLTGMSELHVSLRVKVTCSAAELGPVADSPLIEPIGAQCLEAMDVLWSGASAAFFPSTVESFGYPLAESRAIGVPIIAVENSQNREIGGGALIGFQSEGSGSLAHAIEQALDSSIEPDPLPFDPGAYFEWLTTL